METTNNSLLQQIYLSLSGMGELLNTSEGKAKIIANEFSEFSTFSEKDSTMNILSKDESLINQSESPSYTQYTDKSETFFEETLPDTYPSVGEITSESYTISEELSLSERISSKDTAKIAETAAQFAQIMMMYDAGIKEIKTKLDILSNEFKVRRNRSPIESVQCRIKEPASIIEKMKRRGYPMNLASMTQNISDIAGVRVICPFIQDIYTVAEMLTNQDDIFIIRKKDYISRPKENGYRSLHLVIEIPVFLSDRKQHVRVEVQIRTIAMDFWASLEHQLHYKKEAEVPEGIIDDLKRCAQAISETDEKMQEIARKLKTI